MKRSSKPKVKWRDPQLVKRFPFLKTPYRTIKYGLRYLLDEGYRCRVRKKITTRRRLDNPNLQERRRKNQTKRAKRNILGDRKFGYCMHCKHKFPRADLTIDHIIRVVDGGKHEKANFQMLCLDCHRAKDQQLPKNKFPEEWRNTPFKEAFEKIPKNS